MLILASCFVAALTGCAGVSQNPAAIQGSWINRQGGELHDQRLERVHAIGSTLPVPATVDAIRFHVIQSRSLTAFTWRTGDVYLSAGLVDAATDDEIAAVIAHEFGHLMNEPRSAVAAALRGSNSPLEIEESADTHGIALLRTTGRSPDSLISVLSKVRAASGDSGTKSDIGERIKLLRTQDPK